MARTQAMTRSGHFHAVRFYKDAESLAHLVAGFLGDGLAADQPAIVIGTEAHRVEIERELRALSFDTDHLQRTGRLVLIDAEQTLSCFMVDGMPDGARFGDTIAPVIERAAQGRSGVTVRAYGEMVDVLWKGGQTAAAVRLETLWNQLAGTHQFALLCGYAMGSFYKQTAKLEDVIAQHTRVIGNDASVVPFASRRARLPAR